MVMLVINLEHGVGSKGNGLTVDLLEIHILWTTLRFFLVDSATSTVPADDFVRQSKANLTVRIITIATNGPVMSAKCVFPPAMNSDTSTGAATAAEDASATRNVDNTVSVNVKDFKVNAAA
jgi:hypothetical protein